MKKLFATFLIAAVAGSLCLCTSAESLKLEEVELAQQSNEEHTFDEIDCDSDYSPSDFISAISNICENATDIKTLIEDIKNTNVKTEKREFVVSDVQVLKDNAALVNVDEITNINDFNNAIVKVFYDNGEAWVEMPIKKQQVSAISTLSTNGNQYGFILPLDREDLLTNCLTCRFECEKNGQLCEWCIANDKDFANRIHTGLDMSWSGISGANIRAVSSGVVYLRGSDPDASSWGNYVSILHSNDSTIRTLYAHMKSAPLVKINQNVSQGTIIGYVGQTGMAFGDHLHFEVYKNGTRVNPLPYLQGAVPYGSAQGEDTVHYLYVSGTYKICDGPINIRESPSTTSKVYGYMNNGTVVKISEIKNGNNSYVFGKIASGDYKDKWVALGKSDIEMYAVNTSATWKVFDGPINVRESASTSSKSFGAIANNSTFKITDVTTGSGYIFAKISSSPTPTLASNSTCTVNNTIDHWVSLKYCKPI